MYQRAQSLGNTFRYVLQKHGLNSALVHQNVGPIYRNGETARQSTAVIITTTISPASSSSSSPSSTTITLLATTAPTMDDVNDIDATDEENLQWQLLLLLLLHYRRSQSRYRYKTEKELRDEDEDEVCESRHRYSLRRNMHRCLKSVLDVDMQAEPNSELEAQVQAALEEELRYSLRCIEAEIGLDRVEELCRRARVNAAKISGTTIPTPTTTAAAAGDFTGEQDRVCRMLRFSPSTTTTMTLPAASAVEQSPFVTRMPRASHAQAQTGRASGGVVKRGARVRR
ncbi:uncharacterized protein K452DRAFT_359352 [Aplosporella prunicola CBS 121167]|uniref:Uncharacterized protein n=1 Tax=Aplosporella prunicola CBS 121167 TaxID=1176127 RepID=A0A6A6BBF5_9PEZI|nr:uncharacterized protein K452DRAFT_359352 [Aplosporella prunicola CBS 121167]KAF2140928.1 hypothetical protein K452DRAFT_359352 [Aplosporella prunicola CBS 121167]